MSLRVVSWGVSLFATEFNPMVNVEEKFGKPVYGKLKSSSSLSFKNPTSEDIEI